MAPIARHWAGWVLAVALLLHAQPVRAKQLTLRAERRSANGLERILLRFDGPEKAELQVSSNFLSAPGKNAALGTFTQKSRPELKADYEQLVQIESRIGPGVPAPEGTHPIRTYLGAHELGADSTYAAAAQEILRKCLATPGWSPLNAVRLELAEGQRIRLIPEGPAKRRGKNAKMVCQKESELTVSCQVEGFGRAYLLSSAPIEF